MKQAITIFAWGGRSWMKKSVTFWLFLFWLHSVCVRTCQFPCCVLSKNDEVFLFFSKTMSAGCCEVTKAKKQKCSIFADDPLQKHKKSYEKHEIWLYGRERTGKKRTNKFHVFYKTFVFFVTEHPQKRNNSRKNRTNRISCIS